MKVTALYTYPVKSLAGIALESADLIRTGLRFDRQWMLVEPDGTFMTQRLHPQMALVQPSIHDGTLTLSTFGMEDLIVDTPAPEPENRLQTAVWGDIVNGVIHEGPTNEWLSDAIGANCKLVSFPDDEIRSCDPACSSEGDHTHFADGYPILLTSQESLDDLNARLQEPIGMDRFRPNIVVSGCQPFEEDSWRNLEINEVGLRFAKHCGRCSVPTVNPATGMLEGPEPIRTLSGYRQRENGEIYFGVNLIPETTGTLHIGDRLRILN